MRSRDDFAAFENDDRWNGHDVVLHSEIHVIGNIYFADFGFAVVVSRQFFNDWTQSFARRSGIRVKVNEHGLLGLDHFGLKAVWGVFGCHSLPQSLNGIRVRKFELCLVDARTSHERIISGPR